MRSEQSNEEKKRRASKNSEASNGAASQNSMFGSLKQASAYFISIMGSKKRTNSMNEEGHEMVEDSNEATPTKPKENVQASKGIISGIAFLNRK